LRSSDPTAKPGVILRPKLLGDGAQTIVARLTAPRLESDLPGRKVELVMDDEQVLLRELEKCKGRTNAVSRPIHEGLRFEHQDTLAQEIQLRELAFEAGAKPDGPVPLDQSIDGTETDVVSGRLISRAGIAQSDD
jgi:hypothetical protein